MAPEVEIKVVNADPLLSVIVPVYQVEPWLERCVRSIRQQTYRHLEIILVDDGSPDRCGEICERLALQDSRIKVIHQANQGLSAARNTGLNCCQGEYVGFVDSDDVIHPEMYSRLFADLSDFGARLAFCQPEMCRDSQISFPHIRARRECLSGSEILRISLQENKWFSACSKLYHRSLFETLRFPEGRINEDYPVTARIFSQCEKIVIDYSRLYAYRKRENSITTSGLSDRSFDQAVSAEEVYLFVKESHPDCVEFAARNLFSTCIGLLLKTSGEGGKPYRERRAEVFALVRKYYDENKANTLLSPTQRLLLRAARSGDVSFDMAATAVRVAKWFS
ncbi:MAG: glycosyltransferase [Bacteroidales bacterium]|nr:glycosyltransferase [Bacteroidales bacterium]